MATILAGVYKCCVPSIDIFVSIFGSCCSKCLYHLVGIKLC